MIADCEIVTLDPVFKLLALLVDLLQLASLSQVSNPRASADEQLGILDGQVQAEAFLRREVVVLYALLHESLSFSLDLTQVGHLLLTVRVSRGKSDLPFDLIFIL